MVATRWKDNRVLVSLGTYHAVVKVEDGRVHCGAARLPYSQDALLMAASDAGWETYDQALRIFQG